MGSAEVYVNFLQWATLTSAETSCLVGELRRKRDLGARELWVLSPRFPANPSISQPIPPSPALKGDNGSSLRGFSSSALFLARQVDAISGLGLQVLEAWEQPGSLLVSRLKPQKCPDFKSWRQGIPKPQIPGALISTLYKTPADYLLGM